MRAKMSDVKAPGVRELAFVLIFIFASIVLWLFDLPEEICFAAKSCVVVIYGLCCVCGWYKKRKRTIEDMRKLRA